MQSSPWRIDDNVARLESEPIRAEIDLLNPAGGVKVASAAGATISDVALFQIGLPATPGTSPAEFFARGNDLIAIYSERPDHPFRAQIYWRLIPSLSPDERFEDLRCVAALELILSIQTSLLDSDPALEVATEVAARQARQLANATSAQFVELPATATPVPLGPNTGAGCFQFPLADSRLTYIEMIHPADFHTATLTAKAFNPSVLRLAHRLFPERLEKGVILRSRLRAVFAPATLAALVAARTYKIFAESEPPLTT